MITSFFHPIFILFLFLSLSLLPPSSPLRCFRPPPPSLLPSRRDCRAIIAGIEWVSTRPSENYPRSWGRHLPATSTTENLPKVFTIEGRRPPNLCAVEVDVDAEDIYEVNVFSLTDLTAAARRVYQNCLMGRGKIGLDYPMAGGKVWGKLLRIEYIPPVLGERMGWGPGRLLGNLGDEGRLVLVEGAIGRRQGNLSIVESR